MTRAGRPQSPSLFEAQAPRPLADRLRPRKLGEVVGQDHLLGIDGPIGRMLSAGRLASMILWGPPGSGKTTIAHLLAEHSRLAFEPLSAVFSGVADLRKVFDAARGRRAQGGGTLLFVDEIHRFNRAQQDAFLPVVEDGTVTLVGATTENPSFELNGALLSRTQVFVLRRLDDTALETLLAHELAHVANNDRARMTHARGVQEALSFFLLYRGLKRIARWLFTPLSELEILRLSRAREFAADGIAAQLVGPEHMISVLAKLQQESILPKPTPYTNLMMWSGFVKKSWLATHPPLEDRIAALEQFSQAPADAAAEVVVPVG